MTRNSADSRAANVMNTPLGIGVMINNLERDRLKAFQVARDLGFTSGQTSWIPESWFDSPEQQQYIDAARQSGLQITAMFAGFDGQDYSNLETIRQTVGLVQPNLREHRKQIVFKYIDLAKELGVMALAAHIGFMPHDHAHLDQPLVQTMRVILEHCAAAGQEFLLETGQEPAEVLLQFIHDVDRPNLGVNFDPANLILYGTDQPLPALDLLKDYVRGVHCKDGLWPKSPGELGTEVPIGQGDVGFAAFLKRLKEIGYKGPLTIEREGGPNVVRDVLQARAYLQTLCGASEQGYNSKTSTSWRST